MHTILVYGTLRPFLNTDVVKVPGKLYDFGWYPGIVLGGDSEVVCERITVDDKRLEELDRYEGYCPDSLYSSLYLRIKIGDDGAPEGQSWIYVYNRPVEGFDLIESGDWQQHTLERA